MVIRKRTQGSGLTETEIQSFEGNLSLDEENALAQSSILHTAVGRLKMIEESCALVLEAAGLPVTPGNYECDENGSWRRFGESQPPLRGQRFIVGDPWSIAKRRGIEPDSSEGFAARMIEDILWLRKSRAKGDHERALMFMFYLGIKWAQSGIKEKHQPTWDTGHKQRKTLARHRATSIEAKQAKAEEDRQLYQAEADEVWAANSVLTKTRVGHLVAERLQKRGIYANSDTIRRAIKKRKLA